MDAQSIDMQEPQLERAPRPAPSQKGSTDSLVEAALDAFTDAPAPSNDNGKPPVEKRRAKQEADPAPDADEGEEEALAAQADSGVEGEEEDGDAQDSHDLRGSREEPFSVKDLPADKFIEVKVDGEKMVVPLSELAAGYVREQTFHQRINRTKQLADEAQAAVAKATEFPKKLAGEFRTFVSDHEQLFDFFTKTPEREAVLEKVARKYAELRIQHRENPEARLQWLRQRDEAQLREREEAFEQQRQREHQERVQREQTERAMNVFKPGWEAGLRRAGFPTPTRELFEEVQIRANQRVASGHVVTSADIEEFVVRACKLLELKPGNAQKPRAAPPPARKPEPRRTQAQQWDKVPAHKKRSDPEFFLSSLKPRDFR